MQGGLALVVGLQVEVAHRLVGQLRGAERLWLGQEVGVIFLPPSFSRSHGDMQSSPLLLSASIRHSPMSGQCSCWGSSR